MFLQFSLSNCESSRSSNGVCGHFTAFKEEAAASEVSGRGPQVRAGHRAGRDGERGGQPPETSKEKGCDVNIAKLRLRSQLILKDESETKSSVHIPPTYKTQLTFKPIQECCDVRIQTTLGWPNLNFILFPSKLFHLSHTLKTLMKMKESLTQWMDSSLNWP